MSSLAITNDEVYAALGYFLGISRLYNDWDTETQDDIKRIIRSGKRKFFGAHNWKFLEQQISLVTSAPQTAGSISATDGTVTLTDATWPADVVDDYVLVADGGVYRVAERTSGTVIVLHNTSVDIDAGTEYTLYKVNYELPSTFGGWLDPVTLENNVQVREYATLPEWAVRSVGNQTQIRDGRPEMFSVSQRISDTETGIPEWYLSLYPLPDAVYVMYSRIRIQPGDTLAMADDVPVAHAIFSECLLEAILAAAESASNDTRGVHHARYNELLAEAIKKDNSLKGLQSLPSLNTMQARNALYQLQVAPVTYNEI